jgi:hypothetical protein
MTKRNTDLLSNNDMYEKYANVVEVVRNSKISIIHAGNTNMVQYHGLKGNKHIFRIFSAKPNVKGIEKFVGIIHELAHVLFQSPFDATKKLFRDNWGLKDEDYKFFFNVFNVLEDQRIESQMGKMYLKHASRFDKTTKKLGKLMGDDLRNQNPIDILLTIRFQRGNDIVSDTKDYDVYAKALEDVLLTDRFGALRVMVTLKPYLDKYLSDRKEILDEDNQTIIEGDGNGQPKAWEQRHEMTRENNDFQQNNLESSGETDLEVPEELLNPDEETKKSKEEIMDTGKQEGEGVVNDIFESLRGEVPQQALPKRVKLVKRESSKVRPNMKIAKGLSKIFKTMKMQKKDFIDSEGEEVDVDTYVENLIRGNNLNNCRVNKKITNGIALVISIDGSSSMRGDRMNTASKLVATMYESIKDIDNVEIRANVWGSDGKGIIGMTEINSKGDLDQISCHRNYSVTPTHMGLEYSAQMLKKMKGSKKMMIMITDGMPNYYVGGYHMSFPNYMKTCTKSMLKARKVTNNLNCIVVSSRSSYRYNPVRRLFKTKNIMQVDTMNDASEKVIKQFKRMVMSSFV